MISLFLWDSWFDNMVAPKSGRWIRSREIWIDHKGHVAIWVDSAISEHEFDHVKSACSIFGNMFLYSYLKCISEKEIKYVKRVRDDMKFQTYNY